MRLTQIKLSGFKSFVDPTHFHIPGQLVGVVGPNGCGKSNIIDAARWVLGESKASELRGESMQDVIFNGSGNRKPAGRASVELVFDNPEGRAGGQWSQYAEIAVKRVLTRDGTSTYYINNQVVRRRDVQDIFMGTGLGPRAYAIIGQGMISRIIEAKPEELRIFLEEAAGVSKYKERRRETENRLGDTRENLTRVEDIRRELGANLDKLESQAVVAQQYRDLQANQDEKQKLLWLLRRNEAGTEQERHARSIAQSQVELEGATAELRHVEAELEKLRAAHYTAGDAVHNAQGAFYEAAANVNTIEAQIKFVVESRNRLQAQALQLAAQQAQWMAKRDQAQADVVQAQATLSDSNGALEELQARAEEANEMMPELEELQRAAALAVQAARAVVSQVEQALQLESLHQRNADRNLQNLAARQERLTQEKTGLAHADDAIIERLQVELGDGKGRLTQLSQQLEAAEESHPAIQAAREQTQQALATQLVAVSQTDARLNALRQLQASVQSHDKLQPWLEKHELTALPRLWERLHIEPGWETALEAVLRERIAALELSQLDWASGFFGDAPPARLAFFSSRVSDKAQPAIAGLVPILSLLQINDHGLRALLADWLNNIFVVDTASDALSRRAQLPDGGVFVVRDGHVIERNAVRFYAAESEQAGMLARQQEMEQLGKQQRAQQLLADEARTASVQADARWSSAQSRLAELRVSVATLTAAVHGKELELNKISSQQEQVRARANQIDIEDADIRAQRELESAARAQSELKFEELDARLADVQGAHEQTQVTLESAQATLESARARARELEREVQEKAFESRNIDIKINGLLRDIEVSSEQMARIADTTSGVQLELEGISDATAQTGLQAALDLRVERERRLEAARNELDGLTAAVRAADELRVLAERALEPLRVRIGEIQLKEQACRLNQEQFQTHLDEAGADLVALDAVLVTDAGARLRPNAIQAELNRGALLISELGAVNLAALDELSSARERKSFLDAQSADLGEAIDTLEDAIRRIDKETRSLLQDTFDAVNGHFGQLFPALFGGGEARLMMTGEEILDAGVQVMAQPPGKKNSTIHLLSGGEKALTATALVFAMFALNPAPFCLLDEVDAPLDDANTERFCNLVKKMSVQTQFLFISHNKIAMEMANQLIGVTMQEQGVSRIVAVDMESAFSLASESFEKAA